MTLARENQASFEEYLSNNPNANPGIDLTVTVLTTGFWPSYKSFDLNLPAEMVMLGHIEHLKLIARLLWRSDVLTLQPRPPLELLNLLGVLFV